MKISIGNNNKIKNANIGENNNSTNNENQIIKKIIEIIIGIAITLLCAYIVFKLGWNK